jgi:hypothetical protein
VFANAKSSMEACGDRHYEVPAELDCKRDKLRLQVSLLQQGGNVLFWAMMDMFLSDEAEVMLSTCDCNAACLAHC